MESKTNAMRILDRCGAVYRARSFDAAGAASGTEAAQALGEDPARVFKTLVTVGKSERYHVFVIPVGRELDLKKAAACAGEKSLGMIRQKELLPVTGYVHGGCSPIGMKKSFPTVIDASARGFDAILFSAGRIGFQVELSLDELKKAMAFTLADVT